MKRRTIATLAALALACQACAPTGLPRPNEPLDKEVGRLVRRVRGDRTMAHVEQHGKVLTVRTAKTCNLEKVRVVDRSTLVPLEDVRTAPIVLVLVGGTMSLLGIVGLAIAAGTAGANDGSAGRTAAVGGGVTVVGAALLTGGLIAARRGPTAVSVERVDLEDGLLQKGVPCRDVPNAVPHEPVTLRSAGPPAVELSLGDTGASGTLEVDLVEALPPSLLRDAPAGATLAVFVRASEVGTLRLDEVASAFEADAWARAGGEACATGSTEDACSPLERYLRELPAGAHAAEARADLERGKAALPARIAAAAKERVAAARDQARQAAEASKQRAAAEAARRDAGAACLRICRASCKGDAGCASRCSVFGCP